ncbi:MAG: hypothetical protein IT582_00075 [Opitutaceae bacterium]|nr:hypothetical protein [Opitutaceae bacterium]
MSSTPSKPSAFRWRSPLPTPRVRGRLLVITHRRDTLGGWLSKQQGLFSEFFAVLGALRYAERNGAAGVQVEFSSALYRDPRRAANWWSYFFAPLMWLGPPQPDAPVIRANGWTRFGPHAWNDSWTSQIIPGNTNRQPYPIDSAADLREAARLTARHIRLRPELLARLETLWAAQIAPGDFVVGLHYRGTDKINAYPYRAPDYRLFAEQLDRVIAKHQPKTWRLFVATDETEFIDWALGRYGDRVFFQSAAPRLSSADKTARRTGTHKNLALPAYLKGETAVLDCLLLSRCHHLIKNRSSLSDISLAFNAVLPWTFILDDGLIYEGDAAD